MLAKITKIGRVSSVIIVTVFSVVLSILITHIIFYLADSKITTAGFLTSFFAPLIIAPICAWHILGLVISNLKLQEELNDLLNFDHLSGLLSRRTFFINCESAFEITIRNQLPLSFVAIDLDNFKIINDTFGHLGGDEVLKVFGGIVKGCIRKADLAGRTGGEEFALVLSNTNLEGASKLAEKIRNLVENSEVMYMDKIIQFSISVGIACFDLKNQVDLKQLYLQSDNALYFAKKSGKNCVKIHSAY